MHLTFVHFSEYYITEGDTDLLLKVDMGSGRGAPEELCLPNLSVQ